jgi:hypothetical protein
MGFDLIALNGRDLRLQPLVKRQARANFATLTDDSAPSPSIARGHSAR